MPSVRILPYFHWETKGRFRKRVVLANVPSFRFSFRRNIRTYTRSGFFFRSGGTSKCTLVPVFVRGDIRPNHPFGKPPLCQPEIFIECKNRVPMKYEHCQRSWEISCGFGPANGLLKSTRTFARGMAVQ